MKNKAMEYREVLIGGDMASLTGYIEQITSTLPRKTVKWEITKKNNGTFDLHVEVSEAEYDYLIQHI